MYSSQTSSNGKRAYFMNQNNDFDESHDHDNSEMFTCKIDLIITHHADAWATFIFNQQS